MYCSPSWLSKFTGIFCEDLLLYPLVVNDGIFGIIIRLLGAKPENEKHLARHSRFASKEKNKEWR